MKLIIAGSRTLDDPEALASALYMAEVMGFDPSEVTEVVSGADTGTDTLGEQWAKARGIPVKQFPAKWNKFGRSAGPIRNRQMARYADALLAVWDGQSRGTRNMIRTMHELEKPTYICTHTPE